MFLPACLSVSRITGKKTWTNFDEIFGEVGSATTNYCLDFSGDPDHAENTIIFNGKNSLSLFPFASG